MIFPHTMTQFEPKQEKKWENETTKTNISSQCIMYQVPSTNNQPTKEQIPLKASFCIYHSMWNQKKTRKTIERNRQLIVSSVLFNLLLLYNRFSFHRKIKQNLRQNFIHLFDYNIVNISSLFSSCTWWKGR